MNLNSNHYIQMYYNFYWWLLCSFPLCNPIWQKISYVWISTWLLCSLARMWGKKQLSKSEYTLSILLICVIKLSQMFTKMLKLREIHVCSRCVSFGLSANEIKHHINNTLKHFGLSHVRFSSAFVVVEWCVHHQRK